MTALSAIFVAAAALDVALSIVAARWVLRWLDGRARVRRRLAQTRSARARLSEPADGLAGALTAMRAGAINDRLVEHPKRQLISPFGFDRSAA
jgi:HAMP domain-containing protein